MSAAVLLSGCTTIDPLGVSLLGGLIAIWIYVMYFGKGSRTMRKLRAAKPWAIGELPEDTVGRVIGEAQALDKMLVGPLTGRPCVCYMVEVEQRRSSGSSYWRTIISEALGVTFRLVDQTGHAIVDPTDAQISLTFDGNSTSGTFDDATPAEEAFLAKHGQASKGWIFNKQLRYREAIIEVGETVAVLGSGVREGDPTAAPPEGYRSAPPTRLRLTSSARFPLVISDDPSTTRR